MLDYIINQSCDDKRVVDIVHVRQAQRYGKLIELKTHEVLTEDTLNTPRPRHCLDMRPEYNSGVID